MLILIDGKNCLGRNRRLEYSGTGCRVGRGSCDEDIILEWGLEELYKTSRQTDDCKNKKNNYCLLVGLIFYNFKITK